MATSFFDYFLSRFLHPCFHFSFFELSLPHYLYSSVSDSSYSSSFLSFITSAAVVSSDRSLYFKVNFPSNGSYDILYGDSMVTDILEKGKATEGIMLQPSLSSPLPRVVGWETNERYKLTIMYPLIQIHNVRPHCSQSPIFMANYP